MVYLGPVKVVVVSTGTDARDDHVVIRSPYTNRGGRS